MIFYLCYFPVLLIIYRKSNFAGFCFSLLYKAEEETIWINTYWSFYLTCYGDFYFGFLFAVCVDDELFV